MAFPLNGGDTRVRIDRDLSYLGVSWLTCGEAPRARRAGPRMSYAEARNMWHPYLTAERLSFFVRMRDLFRESSQFDEVAW